MTKVKKYYIHYELGMHHINIETTKEDFNKVIDDLSFEFEIHRQEIDGNPDFVTYKILNYWNDLQLVGYIKEIALE